MKEQPQRDFEPETVEFMQIILHGANSQSAGHGRFTCNLSQDDWWNLLFHFLVVNTFLALCAKTKHCREDNQWRERLLLCLTEKCVCVCVYCAQILITGFSLSLGYSSTILYFPVTFHGSLMNVQLKSKWAFAYRTDYTCGGIKATTWM